MEVNRRALICGVSGQDGAYLAQFLLGKGYQVWGTSRNLQDSAFMNLTKLGIKDRVNCLLMYPEDFRSVMLVLRKSNPDEIYYLAGQSSVGLSFENPVETMQSIVNGTLNILEGSRMMDKNVRALSSWWLHYHVYIAMRVVSFCRDCRL